MDIWDVMGEVTSAGQSALETLSAVSANQDLGVIQVTYLEDPRTVQVALNKGYHMIGLLQNFSDHSGTNFVIMEPWQYRFVLFAVFRGGYAVSSRLEYPESHTMFLGLGCLLLSNPLLELSRDDHSSV